MANREQNSEYFKRRVKISYDEFCQNSRKFYKPTRTMGLKTEFMLHMQEKYPEIAFRAEDTKKNESNGYQDWNIINMLFKLKDFVENDNNVNDQYIKREHFEQLKNSGLLFKNYSYKIAKLAEENPNAVIDIIGEIFKIWPRFNMEQTALERLLEKKLEPYKIITLNAPHDYLRDYANTFLKERKCYVMFPARTKDIDTGKVFQVDCIGWADEGDIYVIDAKRTKPDFKKFFDEKYKLYRKKCNYLYLIINNKSFYEDADETIKNKIKNSDIGILYPHEAEGRLIILKTAKRKKTDDDMLSYVCNMFKKDVIKKIDRLDEAKMKNFQDAFKLISDFDL